MVSFSTTCSATITWDYGPHFWNSGAFPCIATTLACCQQCYRQVWLTASDRRKLIRFIAPEWGAFCLITIVVISGGTLDVKELPPSLANKVIFCIAFLLSFHYASNVDVESCRRLIYVDNTRYSCVSTVNYTEQSSDPVLLVTWYELPENLQRISDVSGILT